jgi:hypothetical protein
VVVYSSRRLVVLEDMGSKREMLVRYCAVNSFWRLAGCFGFFSSWFDDVVERDSCEFQEYKKG